MVILYSSYLKIRFSLWQAGTKRSKVTAWNHFRLIIDDFVMIQWNLQ
ncbi:MAG: hypothetical protein LBC02_06800 [Planctomycetaceae bacterium]|nr:hypothetical protein [Planctomycetaceae bacterium]